MARVTIAKAYERVNGTWPEIVPAMTPDEAVAAARRLYRWAMGDTWRLPVVVTSGNRYSGFTWRSDGNGTASRQPVIVVNPEQGWKTFVHSLSHAIFYKANPGEKPHSKDHARVERKMIEQVIKRGWLDGRLRKQPKPKPTKIDKKVLGLVAVDSLIEQWERKAKRAASALKRLHERRKAIVRQLEKQLHEAETPRDVFAAAVEAT